MNLPIGRIAEASGDVEGAVAGYRAVVRAESYFGAGPIVPFARLQLAALLEKTGDAAGAKAEFDVLRELWKEADADFVLKKRVK